MYSRGLIPRYWPRQFRLGYNCFTIIFSGVLFVIDCADRERIQEAKEELHRILSSQELRGAPIVIVANKQDLPGLLLFVLTLKAPRKKCI